MARNELNDQTWQAVAPCFFEASAANIDACAIRYSAISPNASRKDQQSVNHGDWIHETSVSRLIVRFNTNKRASERASQRTNGQVTRLCPTVNAALHFTLAAYEPPILSPLWPNTYVCIHTITRNIIFPRQICFRREKINGITVCTEFFYFLFFFPFNSSFWNVNPLESKVSLDSVRMVMFSTKVSFRRLTLLLCRIKFLRT